MERLAACLRLPAGAAGSLAAGVIGLSEIGMADGGALAKSISAAVAREFSVELLRGRVSPPELTRATRLAADKYRSTAWNERPLETTPVNTTRTR
jgi:hypothetical protein